MPLRIRSPTPGPDRRARLRCVAPLDCVALGALRRTPAGRARPRMVRRAAGLRRARLPSCVEPLGYVALGALRRAPARSRSAPLVRRTAAPLSSRARAGMGSAALHRTGWAPSRSAPLWRRTAGRAPAPGVAPDCARAPAGRSPPSDTRPLAGARGARGSEGRGARAGEMGSERTGRVREQDRESRGRAGSRWGGVELDRESRIEMGRGRAGSREQELGKGVEQDEVEGAGLVELSQDRASQLGKR